MKPAEFKTPITEQAHDAVIDLIRKIAAHYDPDAPLEDYCRQYNRGYDEICQLKHDGKLTLDEWVLLDDFLDCIYGDIPDRYQMENA